jgi:starch phosphorylase
MKVLVNGGLNLSELDGWWAEAYDPAVGWALGDRMEHDSDPAWDAAEAERLYALLENEIIPEFYDRDDSGIPRRWTARVRESMARLVPEFSSNRMMADYLDRYYVPAAASFRERTDASAPAKAGGTQQGDVTASIEAWRALLDAHWDEIRFVNVEVATVQRTDGPVHEFSAELEMGQVSPQAVLVEVYADPLPGGAPERHVLTTDTSALKKREGSAAIYPFRGTVPASRPAEDYTPRVVPWHPSALVPLECNHILWYR